MSDDPHLLQRMIDDYADGCLDAEQMRALVEWLRRSEAARDHLAAVAVAERLLRAAGQGGVPVERVMMHLREAGVLPAGGEAPVRAAGRLPLWIFLCALVAVAVAAGLSYRAHRAGRVAPPPAQPRPMLGDGSDEPGFVPPPPRVGTRSPESPRPVLSGQTNIPGGDAMPMVPTEPRTPPKAPVFVTKIKEE